MTSRAATGEASQAAAVSWLEVASRNTEAAK